MTRLPAGCTSVEQLELVELAALAVERPLDALLRCKLGDDRTQAVAGGEHPQRDRDGRLADAAFAGDEHQSLVEEAGHGA